MSETLLNEEDYKEILRRRFGRSDLKFIEASVKPISENVEGFTGEHYKLSIKYEINGESKVDYLFIKTKPRKNLHRREFVEKVNIFRVESFLYNFLYKEFQKFGLNTSFAPNCYYCINEETIVMDDMVRKGFFLPERNITYDIHKCQCGLKSLALLHAAGFVYEEKKKMELSRPFSLDKEYPDVFEEKFFIQYMNKENDIVSKWFNIAIEIFIELINFLPETEEYKADFKKTLKEYEFGKVFAEKSKFKRFAGHGDLWSNNMFFKEENGIATHCCLVDYQVCRYFYPAFDVLLFLHSNTNREFRQKHYKNLLEYYYTTFEDILREYGYSLSEIYPKEDYKATLEAVELEAKLQAYSVHAFTFLPLHILNSVDEAGDNFNEIMFTKRVPQSLTAYKQDERYRNILTSDLYELHDSLYKN